ncbi:16S rRNA (cytosine(1402)-N(4))-methyltransferase [Candidatus Daviesbacteria bacterium RIFCSPHIGHO2_02_FULL_36_13]|uniref:Ribosomal RNA small subunit methyltransferase H n=1 Tax=Candidatus Daviesbacteria bacterium RIFCSPHIGHO2_02_FULL_36_13 TaxID=1797768 RepID=A0A1F5JNR7_9BACT|nr:MAG: 16S rRNA (cytosine(1402)-N(4))-methyltransferase [Candidatus Daviesbacteria bacterium RIFCSPHIGHO2_02_FULL_36_13]OGE43986.1 MAG: 16S rRNA (cytosine(1402)-N(4))-methyltransferase [Candidatus Daviesbacteria bacterium RIFCSPLOWO2_01_FULL_36_8]
MEGYHDSVLLREVIEALRIEKDRWYLDCTLGDGGHSLEILRLGGRVVGVDCDPEALKRVSKRFEEEGIDKSKFVPLQGNFRDFDILIQQTDAGLKFAGAIFDLGVSSLQLMSPGRGFSFSKDGPLDMRMDPTLEIQALDLVNNLSGKELYELFKNLGEEKYSKRLGNALVLARQIKPFSTTLELANLIERAVGRREKIHPATRVFQALRMVVNDELNAIEEGLNKVKDKIEKNGYIAVISFHSLEDRIVKFAFKRWAEEGLGRIITDKPIVPSEQEVLENPRSRSAKLRIFEAGA